jgi:Zn-dependent peptidase ImmA (M78 family)
LTNEQGEGRIIMTVKLIESTRQENATPEKIPEWESRLWSHISSGNGVTCPVYDLCKTRVNGGWCFSDNQELFNESYGSHAVESDSNVDELKIFRSLFEHKFPPEWKPCPIFKLIEKLADKYLKKANINQPPVTEDLYRHFGISPGIEIRRVPLKAYHGAVWQLDGTWIIHINSLDKPARQKVTLFHEIFHILAHWRGTPIFRRRGVKEGLFNEMLADYFAGCLLMPVSWIKGKWAEVEDLKKMAELFQVTDVSMWIRLKTLDFI